MPKKKWKLNYKGHVITRGVGPLDMRKWRPYEATVNGQPRSFRSLKALKSEIDKYASPDENRKAQARDAAKAKREQAARARSEALLQAWHASQEVTPKFDSQPEKNRQMDKARQHSKTVKLGEKGYTRWLRDPSTADVQGVDSKLPSKYTAALKRTTSSRRKRGAKGTRKKPGLNNGPSSVPRVTHVGR